MRPSLLSLFCLIAIGWFFGTLAAYACALLIYPPLIRWVLLPTQLGPGYFAPVLVYQVLGVWDIRGVLLIQNMANSLFLAAVLTIGVALYRRLRAARHAAAPDVPAP